jgi:hypothetical protein
MLWCKFTFLLYSFVDLETKATRKAANNLGEDHSSRQITKCVKVCLFPQDPDPFHVPSLGVKANAPYSNDR